jgi:ankyrin repeat protein
MSDDDEAVQAADDVHAMVFALDAAAVRAAAAAGVNVNAFDAEGLTPAHYAASADKADMVRVLAEVGVDVNSPASTTVRLCPRRFRCACALTAVTRRCHSPYAPAARGRRSPPPPPLGTALRRWGR